MLLSYDVKSLQRMLDISHECVSSMNMRFNYQKSFCVRIGKRFAACCGDIFLGIGKVDWVTSCSYLGMTIKTGTRWCFDIVEKRRSFFRSFFGLFNKCCHASSPVTIVHLLKTKCLPLLLYCAELFDRNCHVIKSVDFCLNSALRRIFDTNDSVNLSELRLMFGFQLCSDTCKLRYLNFLCRAPITRMFCLLKKIAIMLFVVI